jgi:hypothetical protein
MLNTTVINYDNTVENLIPDLVDQFKQEFPVRYILKRGSAHWSCNDVGKVTKNLQYRYNAIILPDLTVAYGNKHPLCSRGQVYLEGASNFSIAISGMGGVTSYIWEKHMFDTSKHFNMISEEQYLLMCALFSIATRHFYISDSAVLTYAEYAKKSYPKYPGGYYPSKWDLDLLGDDMRDKIRYYKCFVDEFY